MADIHVFFWFDVEDYITPESDDALQGILTIFETHKVRGTFKIVGEKLRALKRRGRWDIINALRRQDIGYHTDYHSVHPTPAEYLKDLDWEEGASEFERRERSGFEEICETFGTTPSCYGQPGSSWVPHVYPILQKWNVPVYLDYAHHIRLHDEPFLYCGVMNIINLQGSTTRFEHRKGEPGLSEAMNRFNEIRNRLMDAGGGTVSIYYHPCEFATHEFWDAVNFAKGANPDRSAWVQPRVKTREKMERELSLLSEYVRYVSSQPNVRCVTANDARDIYADPLRDGIFSFLDILKLANEIDEEIAYVRFDRGFLSPAEIFYLVVSLLGQLDAGEAKIDRPRLEAMKNVKMRLAHPIWGPISRSVSHPGECSVRQFLAACGQAVNFMDSKWRMPDSIRIGDVVWTPAEFLRAACSLLKNMNAGASATAPASNELSAGTIRSQKARMTLEQNVNDAGVWDWVIFPENFTAPRIIELARLQAWTLKPYR